jgi:hypothetical protein
MSRTLWVCALAVEAAATVIMVTQSSYGGLMVNYQFESVDGSPPSGQTTPDSSGNFTSTPGSINAVLGYGTNTPGTNFPNLISGPVANIGASVMSRNPNSAMNFPGGTSTSFTRVEIADASSGALDASFSNFTVALWLNPTSTTGDRFAIGKIGGSGQRGWQISSTGGTSNLVVDYFASTANLTDRTFTIPNGLPLNTWTHVIFAFDGVNQTEALYVNNMLQTPTITGTLTSVPATLNGANNQPFRTGHRGATGATVGSWIGGIDDVMVFNETLAFSPTGSQTGTGSLLVEVPEPASFAYAIIGAALLVAARRNGKREDR